MSDGLLSHFHGVRKGGKGWTARCPAHDDQQASLSISRGDRQPWVMRCHKGCSTEAIVAAAGLTLADILEPRNHTNSNGKIVQTYDYTDEQGTLLYQAVRYQPKGFRQRRPDGKGDWVWDLDGVRRVLYRLDGLQRWAAEDDVVVTEGEKDCDRLLCLKLTATTNAGGAKGWRDEYAQQLVAAGASTVIVLADHDEPGHERAATVAASCHKAGLAVKVPTIPGLHDGPPAKKHGRDISDWLDAGHTRDELAAIVQATPPRGVTTSSEAVSAGRVITLTPASSITPRPVRWAWQDRLALGTVNLLGGREGIGKSIVECTIAADITRGRLPGVYFGVPKAVLIIATEDARNYTIVPRLMAAGADLDRVFFVDVQASEGFDAALSLPRDLPGLEQQIVEHDVAAVWFDPLLSRLDAALDSHKDGEVRQALEPLSAMAERTNCMFVGLIHVNKSASNDPLTTLMASRAFAAVARSVLFVMVDPQDEKTRLLGQPKNNLGRSDLPTLSFQIAGAHVADTPEGAVWTGKLHWTGETERTIREALQEAVETRAENRTAVSEAADWLGDYLKHQGGSDDSAEIKREGAKAGHSHDSIKRARHKLQIAAISVGFPRRTHWMLQSEQSVGARSGETAPTQLTTLTALTGPQLVQSAQSVQSWHSPAAVAPTDDLRGTRERL